MLTITSDRADTTYRRTTEALQSTFHLSTDLSAIPSLVSLRDVLVEEASSSTTLMQEEASATTSTEESSRPTGEDFLSSMLHSSRAEFPPSSPHASRQFLHRALEHLEQPSTTSTPTTDGTAAPIDPPQSLEQSLLQQLTELITDTPYDSYAHAQQALLDLGHSIPRRVCQHPFRRNDIVWVCRTCQADETCVLCHACFTHSNHEGHDVAFYHAQAGGCCDCGDPDAWDSNGFCPRHGPQQHTSASLAPETVQRVEGLVPAVADWLVRCIAAQQVEAHRRAQRVTSRLPPRVPAASSVDERRNIHGEVEVEEDEDMAPQDIAALEQLQDEEEDVEMQDNQDPENQADFDPVLVDMGHVFVPAAASTSKSRHGVVRSNSGESLAQQLGTLGREQHGLYIVLHADEIRSQSQLQDALRALLLGSSTASHTYFSDSLLQRMARVLRVHGQLVVWGTTELLSECSPTQVHCWKDGDRAASARVGAVLLQRAFKLVRTHGLICSLVTRNELQWEQRSVAVLQWLGLVARSCDPLCQTVASCLLSNEHLVPLLRADFCLGASITKAWHSLLLTLLAVPTLKRRLAAAYCDTYRHVTAEYARGRGTLERSGYTLSVQFLNRVTYVVDLVSRRDLLGKLGMALLETLSVATANESSTRGPLNPNHFVLTHRRYSPCISDLKCVLNVQGIPRLFLSPLGSFLKDWMQALSLAQEMDGQVWRTQAQGHVEVEQRGWVGAFNASISLASLYDRLLSWDDSDACPVDPADSMVAQKLPTAVDVAFRVLLDGIGGWQEKAMASYIPVSGDPSGAGGHHVCTASLPFSTLAAKHGTPLAFKALPISQATRWSFHLPLHRFFAACLREVCRRADPLHGIEALLGKLDRELDPVISFELFRGLMEFPMLVLSRAAQIRANLWRRNGSGMRDQVLNYREPPFCRTLRDADILLLQFAALRLRSPDGRDIGCSVLVHLLLHRLGLSDAYLGLSPAPNANLGLYKQEAEAGLYPLEEARYRGDSSVESSIPWPFSPVEDAEAALALVEETLHLLIVLISELPPSSPRNKAEHTKQAKERLRREVIHRLASGPKTHSELNEVQHVLSYWDTTFLNEEGQFLDPDDAGSAALGEALVDVADRKFSSARLTPDQWELRRSAWDEYDPAFYHINVTDHQRAAESRPKPAVTTTSIGLEPHPYAPFRGTSFHPAFRRLQRDMTSDATVLSILYRTLHVHCRARRYSEDDSPHQDTTMFRGSLAYDSQAMSETVLARAVHLFTLGARVWEDTNSVDDKLWREKGGGSTGSIFHKFESQLPTAKQWVEGALLADPCTVMDSEWYKDEESALLLLRRLATGEKSSVFLAQDQSIRAGAAWLCEYATRHNPDAAKRFGEKPRLGSKDQREVDGESEIERKKREAKEKALKRMKAEAAKFAAMMQLEQSEEEEDLLNEAKLPPVEESSGGETAPQRWAHPTMSRSSTFESEQSTVASRSPQRSDLGIPQFFSIYSSGGEATMDGNDDDIPHRLLKDRPRCIICAEEAPPSRNEGEGGDNRKRSRTKTERSSVLAFVGYAQSSTVLKGGGGPPPIADDASPFSGIRRFTGTHVALCGHAMHSECCEAYLATTLHRDERRLGRREEFRCPLCQRLSNSLVPFIDVGVDWCSPVGQEGTQKGQTSMLSDDDSASQTSANSARHALHDFLSGTPWWVGRNDKSVVWDGQCAFVGAVLPDEIEGRSSDLIADSGSSPTKGKRRRVRSLKKRDLYAAWNAMMRTPRFIRKRRLRQKSDSNVTDNSSTSAGWDPYGLAAPEESSSGETVVWRRFMDLLSDLAYRADAKRLGDRQLSQDYGEFRHYQVEKSAYNIANKKTGKEIIDWPACVSTTMLTEVRRQELSREKLLSKLLISIQSFVYSCCCESTEARRLLKNEKQRLTEVDVDSTATKKILMKYGVSRVDCDGALLIMQRASPHENEGGQPFDGRLGKLRYFGLSVIAAAGAVSADLLQLVLCLPLETVNSEPDNSMDVDQRLRAPIAFPILVGHVLTHVTAAMCAACGWARARSDILELAWPVPFSSRGSFYGSISEGYHGSGVEMLVRDCEGFVKLGMLARVLQVLLSKLGVEAAADVAVHSSLANRLMDLAGSTSLNGPGALKEWARGCLMLSQKALSRDYMPMRDHTATDAVADEASVAQFLDACSVAADSSAAFLADAAIVLQVLIPGVAAKYDVKRKPTTREDASHASRGLRKVTELQEVLGIEPLEKMVRSSLVHDVVYNWMDVARSYAGKGHPTEHDESVDSLVQKRLFQSEGFRCYDWPMESVRSCMGVDLEKKVAAASSLSAPIGFAMMQVDSEERGLLRHSSNPLVVFSSRKRVPLLGGYAEESCAPVVDNSNPRISMLPTSYTDLYAELGALCPDGEQTGLCLICGEVLNAGGKGECTKHSFKCGAGSCIFFLLQECVGLLMHNGKAVYVRSPYVDSHGETPQYRGRPLNLDLDRYEVLKELWSGHANRQKVVAERGLTSQQIILDFY